MRKYIEVARIYLKGQLTWRTDVMFSILFTLSKVVFAYLLWGTIFKDKSTVADFTFHSMISYYIIHSFLSQLDLSSKISEELSTRIRNGTFSKYMVIPINIQGYFIAMMIGMVLFYVIFDLVAVGVWIGIFRVQFVFTRNIGMIGLALLMSLLGMLFMAELNYYLGILTFKYEEIGTFLMIKNNIVAFISGSIIPLILLPESLISFMKCFPFYYVTYLPAMLLTGRCEEEAVLGIGVLGCWCIIIHGLIKVTWNQYVKKYDGVGI